MKRTLILLTCDACASWKDRETTDDVETVTVAGGQTLDLCPEHRDGTRRVFALLAEFGASPASRRNGAKVPAPARTLAPELSPAVLAPVPDAAPTGRKNRRGGARARARRANGSDPLPDNYRVCPLCPGVSMSVGSLRHHVQTAHGLTMGDIYGDTCPLCNHTGSPTGLGVHARMAHQVGGGGVPALFALAESQGDPYGVVASRAAVVAEVAAAG